MIKRRVQDKMGQMKLSFGMIFSIILIVVFIAFAIYAVTKLLDIQKGVQVGQFIDEIQGDVDRMWKGSQGNVEQTYRLPAGIESVCLVDFNALKKGEDLEKYSKLKMAFYEFENLIFYPVGSGNGIDSYTLKHVDISKITGINNPQCFPNTEGKVKITVKMDPGDSLVTLSR